MTDFCFQFTNMPPNKYFDGNESVLRFKLWNHINKVIVDQINYEVMNGYEERVQDLQNLHGDYIADITFAKSDSGESNILYNIIKLNKKKRDLKKIIEARGPELSRRGGCCRKSDMDKLHDLNQ